jgi:hypothetical protein
MSSQVRFEGLAELQAALRALPAQLLEEATAIVEGTANGAHSEIGGKYPAGPLRDRLTLTMSHNTAGVLAVLRQPMKEAGWFEKGTEARHTATGANRGRMPAQKVFLPVYYRRRRQMWVDLKAMVERHGLTVTGEP